MKIAVFGHSIPAAEYGYVTKISQKRPGWVVQNFAVSGSLAADLRERAEHVHLVYLIDWFIIHAAGNTVFQNVINDGVQTWAELSATKAQISQGILALMRRAPRARFLLLDEHDPSDGRSELIPEAGTPYTHLRGITRASRAWTAACVNLATLAQLLLGRELVRPFSVRKLFMDHGLGYMIRNEPRPADCWLPGPPTDPIDIFHPNMAGHDAIAEAVVEVLEGA